MALDMLVKLSRNNNNTWLTSMSEKNWTEVKIISINQGLNRDTTKYSLSIVQIVIWIFVIIPDFHNMCFPNIHSPFHTFIDSFFLFFSFLEINILLSSFNHKPASSLNCIFPPGSVLVLNRPSGNSRRCSSDLQLWVNKCLCPLLSSLHRQKPRACLPRYLPHTLPSWPSPLPSSLSCTSLFPIYTQHTCPVSQKRSPSISASSTVIAHLCNAWLFDAWIDVSGVEGGAAGATGCWWVFFLFCFSFFFFSSHALTQLLFWHEDTGEKYYLANFLLSFLNFLFLPSPPAFLTWLLLSVSCFPKCLA